MTSVYHQEKIYPTLPSAPLEDESQTYRLKKIEEVEAFLRCEIELRDKLAKQFKRRAAATTIGDTSLVTTISLLGVASITTFSTGVGFPIGIALASTGLFLGVGSAVVHKTQKIFDSKAKKHDKIKTLAESKLDSISGFVSKAIEDTHISVEEYQFILKEVEKYREMKEDIRTKSKRVTDSHTAEQREELLAQGREEGKKKIVRGIRRFFRYPDCQCHVNYESPPRYIDL